MNSGDSPGINNVVLGHQFRQTRDAQWLCLEDIYQKLHRPNYYDIGGTYIDDVPDYWFSFKTEHKVTNFLIHVFVRSHSEGTFTIAVSASSQIAFNNKSSSASLSSYLKEYQFEKLTQKSIFRYLTTYSFSELEVQTLKNKKLFIPVQFPKSYDSGLNKDTIDSLKAKHDFGVLLTDPIDSDFSIESEDGVQFKVHKALLSAHSDYFKAMLKEDTAESQTNHVKLIGVCAEDLKCILEYVYTGTVKGLENQNCFNLLLLADSYNLKGLHQLTQHVIELQMSIDNAVEVLSLADMCNSEELKIAAFKFIKKNLSVLETNAYKEFNNVSLVKELYKFIIDS